MTAATETTTGRKLATIETITELAPIPDADAIERARIRGWDVVVRKDEFSVGDMVVFFEIDSLLDVEDPRFEFLAARGVRTDAEGRKGHVLRTAKLRGQYSQGLAVRLSAFPELAGVETGDDVTDTLGVVKWEPALPASLSGKVRGVRPGWIPKTDEERVQNCPEILDEPGVGWVATEKIDGSSMSVYVDPGEGVAGVCSRNLDLVEVEANTLWALAQRHRLHERLAETFPGAKAVIQGEAYGEGIQANPLKVKGQRFAAFAIYVDGRRLFRTEWPAWALEVAVPMYVDLPFPSSVDGALAQVDGIKSLVSPDRNAEGVVWVRYGASFKVISNRYLMKNDR